ncbi:MAG: helix-turn-helix transcriptional regulator [Polyangia bacterium]|jgi:DNA-binding XRE family transcriptional regulator
MKLHRWSDIKNNGMTPKRVARADATVAREALSIRLRTLREAAGLTQTELAKRAAITQSQLSRLESSPNVELRSILCYAQAAGASRVEILAQLGPRQIPLAIMNMSESDKKRVHGKKWGKPVKRMTPSKLGPHASEAR